MAPIFALAELRDGGQLLVVRPLDYLIFTMTANKHIQEFAGGEVRFWLEQESSIHLKAISGSDPVELTAQEARKLAEALLVTANQLDALDSSEA